MNLYKSILILCVLLCSSQFSLAQKVKPQKPTPVYIDDAGVLRWTKDNQEASFFGVNYTVPFAYGYRSHRVLGKDLEQAIDQDVYHMARLGFNAFRVHVWDTEISDSLGNLLENEHLRLFDYLIYKLKQRNIKVLVTPIAFWGNGYPEPDQKTPGFSSKYNKQQAVTEEAAFKAQENYLAQFFKHTNPYTGLTYQQDPDIIAAEINNEPKHTGTKARATAYVNRMVKAVKSAGWNKPIYYNISESPDFADAVVASNVDGVSFQWYPTGLVANRTLQGNYLPHVDTYQIPFDTIPAFRNKARMVYEFDAGDVLQPIMYPAMARSFRTAGFQWATQFAYDPMATAYGNTEYQTHYLNLAYTPVKAISMLVAAKVFHYVPRNKSYGQYPASTTFGPFKISYEEQLSEMNTAQEFYYSNNTNSKPAKARALQHIAGVGSSPVVNYSGTGAYFLDKIRDGVWRLEVMPDAIHLRDPFAKASPDKEVTRIEYASHAMKLSIPDLGASFSIKGVNKGNTAKHLSEGGLFNVQPGTYLLYNKDKNISKLDNSKVNGNIELEEFVAPKPIDEAVFVAHEPARIIDAGTKHKIAAKVVGASTKAKVSVLLQNTSGMYRALDMLLVSPNNYQVTVPDSFVVAGELSYRIMVEDGNEEPVVFPGAIKGNPWAWDYYHQKAWKTLVASNNSNLNLYNAGQDREVIVYPNLWRSNERQLLSDKDPDKLFLRLATSQLPAEGVIGIQVYIADKVKDRAQDINSYQKLVVKAGTTSEKAVKLRIALISSNASAYTHTFTVNTKSDKVVIPIHEFQSGKFVLLPRPYPGFPPFWFQNKISSPMDLNNLEKIEIMLIDEKESDTIHSFDVEAVWLEKE